MARRHRRRHHALSNPFSVKGLLGAPKHMISKEFLTEAVSTAAGFVLPNMALQYVPIGLRDTKVKYYLSKTAVIALLSAASGMVSKRAARMVMLGGGVSLLLDIYNDFRTRGAAAPAGTGYYYGGMQGTDYYYGPGISDDIVLSEDEGAGF